MTVNLETEVVETRYDNTARTCIYVVQRGARRWTVTVPLADFDRHKANRIARRKHLANVLDLAMTGPADGEEQG